MRFAFTEEQELFAGAVRDLLAKECPPEAVRASWENETGWSADRWAALADMGVVGLTVPEAYGGLGLGELDLVRLLEESGRVALPEPLVDTTAIAAPLLAESAPDAVAAEWLPRVAAGEAVVAVQRGDKPHLLGAESADVALLVADDELHLVPGDHLEVEPQRSVDGSRRLSIVDWHRHADTRLAAGEDCWAAVNRAFDRGALATAAQEIGLADRMIEMTVDYVKEREQFGVPIGSFQAIKHHLADALLALEFARPVVYRAAYSMAGDAPDRSRDVSMAKVYADEAALRAASTALQCHGAIGYTVEFDLHLFMKRAWALAASWGDRAWHRERVAVSVVGPAAGSVHPGAREE
jgi:alkylation response protein AidB-like acyl-CoA dehydrogenase